MHSRAKQVASLLLPALLFGMLLLSACENDLNKIKEVSSKQVSQPIDTTRGVEVIYSDSAILKGIMRTPLMIHYAIAKPYYKMPSGVKVILYDAFAKETGNIVADSGVYRFSEKIIEFHHHVVCTNDKGETFKSDELIWDQVKKTIYSRKPVQMTTPSGDIMNGIDFTSDDDLHHPIMKQGTGQIYVSEKSAN
ncbi:MAG: LPS export ABC transporter periplasmic protein LptC [Bacteroidota bacterium]